MSGEPRYLLQGTDGILYAYWNLDILRIDLHFNQEKNVKLYVLVPGALIRYRPIEMDSVMRMGA